jgi:hypothetical protein
MVFLTFKEDFYDKYIVPALVTDRVLHISSCSKTKIWDSQPDLGPCEAQHVYNGPMCNQATLFYNEMQTAFGFHPSWIILSAKYGFIDPHTQIERYDISFSEKKDAPYVVTEETLSQQIGSFYKPETHLYIMVWGGAPYVNRVVKVLPASVPILAPAYNLPIGKAIGALKLFRTTALDRAKRLVASLSTPH